MTIAQDRLNELLARLAAYDYPYPTEQITIEGKKTTVPLPWDGNWDALANYVAWHTGLALPDRLPIVRIFSQRHLSHYVGGNPSDPDSVITGVTIQNEIWLSAQWRTDKYRIYGDSVLVHEFVHWLTNESNGWDLRLIFGDADAHLADEHLAHSVQIDWLAGQGQTLEGDLIDPILTQENLPTYIERTYRVFAERAQREYAAWVAQGSAWVRDDQESPKNKSD